MENILLSNSKYLYLQQLQRLRNINKHNKRNYFIQKPHIKNKQRLIPLTWAIEKAMMNFNASQSSTSISEKPLYNTVSITSLVRGEVQNILQELSISEQFIRKEEVDQLIEQCLKEKITAIPDCDAKRNHIIFSDFDISQQFEVTVDELPEDTNKNLLIVENLQILEQRITTLEKRLSYMLQNIPKLRHIQAKRFKINTNALKEELRSMMYKFEKQQEKHTSTVKLNDSPEKKINFYDDLYYSEREYSLNLLNYKKSLETLKLNQKPKLNPYIKPIHMVLPESNPKLKHRTTFLTTNDICVS